MLIVPNQHKIIQTIQIQSLIIKKPSKMQEQVRKSFVQGKPPTTIFALMTLTNILINLDHGILPACTKQLKEYYQMNETELGFLGSVVYLGIVIMGLFAGRLYQRINSKLLTLGALIALQISLFLFVLSSNKIVAYFCRFLTGICQVFLLVYYPIWIDKFGFKRKTLWLTLLQICVPLGIFAGYGMTSLVISLGYQFKDSFYLQIALVALFIIAFGLLSKTKLDSRRKLSQDFNQSLLNSGLSTQKDMPASKNEVDSNHKLVQKQMKQKNKHHSIKQMLLKLWRSKMYFVGTMTMAIILFVSTGIQFWLTDYFVYVLHFEREKVNIAYAVVSLTGPTSGCGLGGYILSKRGGYQSPKAVYLVFIFAVIGIGSALFIPFLDGFYQSATALWLVLFFGGAMMPGLTGIMMASVPPYLRAFGNSTGQIIKNCFGYLPAPFIYGWFNQMFNYQRAGITMLMFWGLWAPILLGIGSVYRYKQLKKIDLNKANNTTSRKLRKLSQTIQEQNQKDIPEEDKIQEQAALISQYLAQEQQKSGQDADSAQNIIAVINQVRHSSDSQIQDESFLIQTFDVKLTNLKQISDNQSKQVKQNILTQKDQQNDKQT